MVVGNAVVIYGYFRLSDLSEFNLVYSVKIMFLFRFDSNRPIIKMFLDYIGL